MRISDWSSDVGSSDLSARDLQAWEYQPLGPFLSKNFASTISPWIVTLEALAPFRKAFERDSADPQPLPYLNSDENKAAGAVDIGLEVLPSTENSRADKPAPALLTSSNFKEDYWNVAQLLAHHTVNGCNLQAGDMLGTGTLSGPGKGQEGSLLELNQGGKSAIKLPWGEERSLLQDHDQVTLRATSNKTGYHTLSMGDCPGTVQPPKASPIPGAAARS